MFRVEWAVNYDDNEPPHWKSMATFPLLSQAVKRMEICERSGFSGVNYRIKMLTR